MKNTFAFNNGVTGGTLATVGTAPMYHHKTHTVYGAPTTQELTGIYADAVSVKIHPASVWDGMDIIPIFNSSTTEMDIWFGNPFDGGDQITIDVSGVNTQDLTGGAETGYDFRPERLFVVGDRMVAYCAVYENSASRMNKIAILSHDMDELQAGTTDNWTIHFVTNEYGTTANNVGGLWPISTPKLIDGSYWCVVCDYDSDSASGKKGGQAWVLEISTAGEPQDMVRLYTRDGGSSEHWHSGLFVSTSTGWRALWHVGDGSGSMGPQIIYRDTTDITTYADNATVDTGSGIGGSYRVSNASASDWGVVSIGAGLDEGTSLGQSTWENAFPLLTDPNDDSKFLYGGDTSGGMIKLMEFDSNDVAIGSVVFNPVAKVKRLQSGDVAARFDVFLVDASEDGQAIVANATNELDEGDGAGTYSGLILSEDGGQTWGWVWRGERTNGVAVLSDGKVIASSNVSTLSLIEITPGRKVSGKPMFIGYRPTNLISNAAGQSIIGNGGGSTTSVGSSPELALPSITHSEDVFRVDQAEGSSKPVLEPINLGVTEATITGSNAYMSLWVRKMDPDGSGEENRTTIENSFNFEFPGASISSVNNLISCPKHSTQDWIRLTGSLDGSKITSLPFNADPSDLRSRIQSPSLSVASTRFEVLYESFVLDHDRPPLPYNTRTASGVSSGKFESLAVGETWTVMVIMEVPEECWDSWTGDENDTWDAGVPLITAVDSDGTHGVTFEGKLISATVGGNGTPIVDGSFNWGVYDSGNATPTTVADNPQRTMPLVVAISKDGTGDVQYAIGRPDGVVSGTRAFANAVDLDEIKFCDIDQTNALEMYIFEVQVSDTASTASELEAIVSNADISVSTGGNLPRGRGRSRMEIALRSTGRSAGGSGGEGDEQDHHTTR